MTPRGGIFQLFLGGRYRGCNFFMRQSEKPCFLALISLIYLTPDLILYFFSDYSSFELFGDYPNNYLAVALLSQQLRRFSQ